MYWLHSAQPCVVTSSCVEIDKNRWNLRLRMILCLFLLPMTPTLATAQVRPLLTRHVRDVTLNGQAQPRAATRNAIDEP